MGIYVDIEWFNNLDLVKLNNLYFELRNIWNAQKTYYPDYEKIIPNDLKFINIKNLNRINLEKEILSKFDNLISLGIDENYKRMGAYIVIGAFSMYQMKLKEIYNNIVFI